MPDTPEIAALLIGDPPQAWSDLGFVVDSSAVQVSGIRHELGGERSGIRAWGVRGLPEEVDDIDGVPSHLAVAPAEPTPAHPNGVTGVDHVVLMTPDLPRTIESLGAVGLELRRTRESDTYGGAMRQAFFRMGPVILEVVGGPQPSGDGPARFFGIAFNVADLDATAAYLGERLHPAKSAVQPGRFIATLDKSAGSTVGIAFMSEGEAEYS